MSPVTRTSNTELWLSLRFTQLALDLLRQKEQLPEHQPIVIAKNSTVYQACETARSYGVDKGTSIHTALLLCEADTNNHESSLIIHDYDAAKNHQALKQLAEQLYEFTPYVSLWQAQQSLLLELSQCLSLFGGLKSLLEKIHQKLQSQQLKLVASLAHTPRASWLLGWNKHTNLLDRNWQLGTGASKGPINHLNSNEDATDIREISVYRLRQIDLIDLPEHPPFNAKLLGKLKDIGVHTLGDFFDLPNHSIAKRYGEDCLRQLHQITGTVSDLQVYIRPVAEFFAERHFLHGLETSAMLQAPMFELMQEFQQFLTLHQFCAESFSWHFYHFDKSHSQLTIELSCGHTRAEVFEQLTLLQLAKHKIQAPIETLALRSGGLCHSTQHNHSLFSEHGNHSFEQTQAGMLYDTLKARLGQNAIYQLQHCDEHLPELRQAFTEPSTRLQNPKNGNHTLDKQLPLWLLSSPQLLSHNRRKRMTLQSSAHRIDSHWWQQHQQRDYFIANDNDGRHWIYFDHRCRCWFIHGHYD